MKPNSSSARDLAKLLSRMEQRITVLERGARTSQLQNASITGTAITVYDEDGTTRRGSIGMQPDGTIGFVAEGGPAPAAPTAPIVTPSIAGLRVTWDGAFADGSDTPADFDHVAVHVSTTSGFTPSAATFAGTITLAGDGGVLPVTPLTYEQHFVLLVGVNTSGVAGGPSAEASGIPLRVDGPDLTAGSVTAGAIEAGAVTADKLEAVLSLVNRIVAGDPAGARVEFNAGGLRVYDATGVETVRFDGATGDAVFTGEVTGSTITGTDITGGSFHTDSAGTNVEILTAPLSGTTDYAGVIRFPTSSPIEQSKALLLTRRVNNDTADEYLILNVSGPQNVDPKNGWVQIQLVSEWTSEPAKIMFVTWSGTTKTTAAFINETRVGTFVPVIAYRNATTDYALAAAIDGETWNRLVAYAGGKLEWGDGTNARDTNLYRSAPNTLKTDGAFLAANEAMGTVSITPAGDGVVTSTQVTGLNVAGSTFRGYVTAATSVPGDRKPAGAAGVTGVSCTGESSSGLTIYVNRQNTTLTYINWLLKGV